MSQTSQPNSSNLFSQFPTIAVALNRLLAERGAAAEKHAAPVPIAKRFLSTLFTFILFAISVFGFYQLATLVAPATHQTKPAVAAAKTVTSPLTAVAPTAQAAPASLPKSIPTSISISSIGVNAQIVSVGQNSDGTLEVPGPYDVGWYNLGPTPGEIGPAVLVGHVDYATTGEAVFWNLRNMQPGDTVNIARQDGKTVSFKVEKVQSYGQESFPTQDVYGNLDYAGLRLITCTGDFNYVTHHYSDNLVVYARAEL